MKQSKHNSLLHKLKSKSKTGVPKVLFGVAGVVVLGLVIFGLGYIQRESVTILNPHSNPNSGDDWVVGFEINGKADLIITPDDQSTIDDLDVVSLKCGGEERSPQILEGDILFYPDWECKDTGEVIHYVNEAGHHTLKFQFGGQTEYAYNSVSIDTSSSSSATASSFQRKTWYDGTRYWAAFHSAADSRIEFWYSADGSSWAENTSARILVNTSDFSIEADSSHAFIVCTDSNDIDARSAVSYPGTSFSWGAASTVFEKDEITYGSESVFNSSTTYETSVSSLDSTHFVVAYRDVGNSYYGTAVIGTVSGSTISYGSEYVFNSSTTDETSVSSLDSTHFVVAYQDSGNFYYGTAVIGTVSGSTISYGSEYVFNSGSTVNPSVSVLDSTHFVVAYQDNVNSGRGTAVIGTISGSTISYGSEYIFNSGWTSELSVSSLDSTHFVVAYCDYDNSNYGTAVIGTVSGSTISYGSKYIFNSGWTYKLSVSSLDSTHFVVAYNDSSNYGYGTAVIGIVSGSTISHGSEYIFNSSSTAYPSVSALDSTHFAVTYRDCGNSDCGTAVIGTVSGSTISYGSEYIFNNSSITYHPSVSALDSTHFVVTYRDSGNSDYGTAIIGIIASGNYSYPAISRDFSSVMWVTAVEYQAPNYIFKAIRSTNVKDISSWESASTLDTSTNSNKYGTIVPLNSGHMYSIWIDNTAIEGKRYNGTSWDVSPVTIGTGAVGMSKNMSAVSDLTNNYIHLVYTDSSNYMKYDQYDGDWNFTDVILDGNVTSEYGTITIDSATNDLYALWGRNNQILRKKATYSAGPTWTWDGSISIWQNTGINKWITSNYSGTGSNTHFALWTEGNGSPYSVMWDKMNIAPTNNSLTFTNPFTGGSNDVVSDDHIEWNFQAQVTDVDGHADLDTVVLRLANSADNTTPYDALKFTWTQSSNTFSETTDTQNAATIVSTGADSNCTGNTCTLDFKIKFNNNFLAKNTDYTAELCTTDDAGEKDEDSYTNFYQVDPVTISISSPPDINLGTIAGIGNSSVGEATWTVSTNNGSGYKLEWQASPAAMTNATSDTIAAYTPGVAGIPELWSVLASDSEWGGRLKSTSTDYDSGMWGVDDGVNAKWLNVRGSSPFEVITRSSATSSSNEITQFFVEVGSAKLQPTGNYTVNITVTATTL